MEKKRRREAVLLIASVSFFLILGQLCADREIAGGQELPVYIGLGKEPFLTTSGQKLSLFGRDFQPGELIIARLELTQPAAQAWLIFKQKKYPLNQREQQSLAGRVQLNGWLAIDGESGPGTYPLRLLIVWPDGKFEETAFLLEIKPREFRERKLQVPPVFTRPPAALRERIEREANLLRWVFALESSTWHGDGSFIWPHPGKLTAFFGDRRVYNDELSSFHNGVDIRAKQGDAVVAANSGQVVVAGNFYFGGNMVVLDHGHGLFTSYNHLSRVLVKRGQMVKKGEVVGLAGSTGLSTGPHLHWSARANEERIDPLCLLSLPFPAKN